MKLGHLLKQRLMVCVFLFVLIEQSIADPLSDAYSADNEGDYAKAAKLYRPLAEQGIASAQFQLGKMYDEGKGIPQNHFEAVKWYRLGAEQGNVYAQLNLGHMYDKGVGVPQDYVEAVKWYRLAAEQGFIIAGGALGEMYYSGKGVPQDFVRAHMWINIFAATSVGESQSVLIALRNQVAEHMTTKQIAEAQELARKCTAQKFKGC